MRAMPVELIPILAHLYLFTYIQFFIWLVGVILKILRELQRQNGKYLRVHILFKNDQICCTIEA